MKPLTLYFSILFTMFFAILVIPAFADRADVADYTVAAYRQEIRADRTHVEGMLHCNQGSINTGAPCMLTIRETQSGKTFQLQPNDEAMRLFQSGTRKVALEGDMTSDSTLSIKKISAL